MKVLINLWFATMDAGSLLLVCPCGLPFSHQTQQLRLWSLQIFFHVYYLDLKKSKIPSFVQVGVLSTLLL